jgi:hypothetical protein
MVCVCVIPMTILSLRAGRFGAVLKTFFVFKIRASLWRERTKLPDEMSFVSSLNRL